MESTAGEPVPSPAPHKYVTSRGLKESHLPAQDTPSSSTTSPPFLDSPGLKKRVRFEDLESDPTLLPISVWEAASESSWA